MGYILGTKSRRHMRGVHPQLVQLAERAIQLTAIDFGIPETGGFRCAEEQKALFDAGRSKADGYKNRSRHQIGTALDFYAYVDKKASWEPLYLAQIACAFLQAACELGIKLEWGGLWTSFQDMPHVQLAGEQYEMG